MQIELFKKKEGDKEREEKGKEEEEGEEKERKRGNGRERNRGEGGKRMGERRVKGRGGDHPCKSVQFFQPQKGQLKTLDWAEFLPFLW